ncbi:ABC transporter permease [Treponema sp.]|uniref:ABC transporter permease n=1 Tax=Treponema sp. TaxID=166 RepID=UPI00298DA23E|nr:FtsX-like permease family protein [Treponema sp.]
MIKSLSLKALALSNLKKNPFRTFLMIFLVAISGAVVSTTFILSLSLKKGIDGIKERTGADLMIVPEGYEQKFESVLLSGNRSYFYLDKSIEEKIRKIEGVKKVTSQFYLTSLSESCCDFPVQIIGFDPESDFLIKPWIEKYSSESPQIFAGSNVESKKESVTFFDSTHKVTAHLAKSGTGMDNSVFADLETVKNIFNDAREKGFSFLSDGNVEKNTSVIFVLLEDKVKPDAAALKINAALNKDAHIQIIQQGVFLKTFTDKMSSFTFVFYVISVLFILITVIALTVIFSLSLYERRREFSILRVIGSDKNTLCRIVLFESLFIGAAGAVTGIFLSYLIIIPFNTLIAQKLSVPFCMPGVIEFISFTSLTLIILALVSVLSALSTIMKIFKLEIYRESK